MPRDHDITPVHALALQLIGSGILNFGVSKSDINRVGRDMHIIIELELLPNLDEIPAYILNFPWEALSIGTTTLTAAHRKSCCHDNSIIFHYIGSQQPAFISLYKIVIFCHPIIINSSVGAIYCSLDVLIKKFPSLSHFLAKVSTHSFNHIHCMLSKCYILS